MFRKLFNRKLLSGANQTARAFSGDRQGNIAMMFALMAIPLTVLLGMGIDYYEALSDKNRLDTAADAAALAAIVTAQQYVNNNSATQANPGLTNSAIAAGETQAVKVFNANAGTTPLVVAATTPIITLTQDPKNSQTFNATVRYTTQTPTNFGSIIGVNAIPITGTSTASLTMGTYLDFYLLLDVSGSMGIPTTTDGQNLLASLSPDNKTKITDPGCVFACHFAGYSAFGITHPPGQPVYIPLRADTVGSAVQNLLTTAQGSESLTNQFRVGIYTFIDHAIQAAPLSSSINPQTSAPAMVASNLANLLDQGTSNNGMGSGGTHFENLESDMTPYLKGSGDGSSALTPRAFIFMVTDGMDNNQTYSPFSGSQPQLPNLSFCTAAKNAGYTVSVLYIPYVKLTSSTPSTAGETATVNNLAPSISASLQSCASPNFFYTANSAADINNAMQAMFAQALQFARLTN